MSARPAAFLVVALILLLSSCAKENNPLSPRFEPNGDGRTEFDHDTEDIFHNPPHRLWGRALDGFIEYTDSEKPYYFYGNEENINVSFPAEGSVKADGFVYIEGANLGFSEIRTYIYAEIDGETYYVHQSTHSDEGAFKIPVYLSYGKGEYTVQIKGIPSGGGNLTTAVQIEVSNVSSLGGEGNNYRFLFPSYDVPTFHRSISQKAEEVSAGATSDMEKAKLLHDWVVTNLMYDYASLTNRKEQDADTVFGNGLAVCEGYANLYAAMCRSLGIAAKYVRGDAGGGPHAWNEIYWDGSWHNVDVTWDDPVYCNGDSCSSDYPDGRNLRYTYFDISDSDLSKDHTKQGEGDR